MATEEEVRSDASSPVTNRPVSTIVANATGRTDGRSMTYAPTAATVSTSSPASAATQVSRRAYQGRLPGTARGTGAGAGAAKTGAAATGAGETGSDTGAAGGCAYSFGVSAADDGRGLVHRPAQQRRRDPLELLAGDVDRLVDAGYRHRGDRGTRQHLLGASHVLPEQPAVAP